MPEMGKKSLLKILSLPKEMTVVAALGEHAARAWYEGIDSLSYVLQAKEALGDVNTLSPIKARGNQIVLAS